MCTTDLASYLLSQWKFWQLTSKWFSGARAQDKNKQYDYCFHFFLFWCNYKIQGKSITWLVNSALNCTWKPISHSSLRDSCDIGFRLQFNSEFSRQVMNFPIKFTLYEEKSGKTFLYLFLVICCLERLTTPTWYGPVAWGGRGKCYGPVAWGGMVEGFGWVTIKFTWSPLLGWLSLVSNNAFHDLSVSITS